jgi:hypothetical protein
MLRPTVRLPAVSPLIPAPKTCAMIVAFRHRLPREASRRGGTGAGLRKDVSLCPVDWQKMVSLSSETGRGVPVRHTSGPATGMSKDKPFVAPSMLEQSGIGRAPPCTEKRCRHPRRETGVARRPTLNGALEGVI